MISVLSVIFNFIFSWICGFDFYKEFDYWLKVIIEFAVTGAICGLKETVL